MIKTIRLIPFFLIVACASAQSQPSEINGKRAFKLTCSEFNSSLEECKVKASELCDNNFTLVDHTQETYPDAGDGFYMHPKHHLAVECNS